MDPQELRYTALIYKEPGGGTWVKIPEYNLQCLTEDPAVGLKILEEELFFDLRTREKAGDTMPERIVKTIRYVDNDEYGPTAAELASEEYFDEDSEDEGGGDICPSEQS